MTLLPLSPGSSTAAPRSIPDRGRGGDPGPARRVPPGRTSHRPGGARRARAHRIGRCGRRLVVAAHRLRCGARHRRAPGHLPEPARLVLRHDRAARARPASRRSRRATWRGRSGPRSTRSASTGSTSSWAARSAAWWRSRSRSSVRMRVGRASCRSPRRRRIGNLAAAWNHIQLELVALDRDRGLELARQLAMTTYRSEVDFDTRDGIASYLEHQGVKLRHRFHAGAYAALAGAMNAHDVGRDRGGLVARAPRARGTRRGAHRGRDRGRHPLRAAPGARARGCRTRCRGGGDLPRDRVGQGPRRVPRRVGPARGDHRRGAGRRRRRSPRPPETVQRVEIGDVRGLRGCHRI